MKVKPEVIETEKIHSKSFPASQVEVKGKCKLKFK